MQRCEHQYSASLQMRKSTTLSCTMNANLLEEERDESNDPQLLGATMDRDRREINRMMIHKELHILKMMSSLLKGRYVLGSTTLTNPVLHVQTVKVTLNYLTMRETILSQQDLIQNLSGFVAADQHQQIQTISSQAEFISTLQASLRQLKLFPAAKLKGDDEQTRQVCLPMLYSVHCQIC